MSDWAPADLLPGLYVLLLGAGLAALLRRWYDAVPWRILAVFGLMIVFLFGSVLFGGGVLLPLGNLIGFFPFKNLPQPEPWSIALQADLVHQITPWAVAVRWDLGAGLWPLWNARSGGGMPLMADPQAQAFQPLVAAAYPFSIWPAAGITAALRVLVALMFSFLLLRRQGLGEATALLGSLAFGLGGFLLLWLGWPMANNAALLPPVLYALARCDDLTSSRDLFLLFLATASLLLSGHPETLVYALAFAGLFLLDRVRRRGRSGGGRLLVRCGLAMALAGGVVAPVLLPIQEYLPKTDRALIVNYLLSPKPIGELWGELVKPETLELWRKRVTERLLPVAAPRAYGNQDYYWGSVNVIDDAGGFVGGATLLAAVAALLPLRGRRRFPQERLALGVLLGALLLVAQPPGTERLLGQLPVVGATFVHQSHRILLLVAFSLAFLGACEIERRTRDGGARWPVLAAAAGLAALVTWGYLAHPNPKDPSLLADLRNRLLITHLAVLALAAGLLMVRTQGRWRAALPWLFCVLVAVELVVVNGPVIRPAPRRLAYPVTPSVQFLQENLGDFRLLGLGPTSFAANFPLVYGLNDVRIDNPSFPAEYRHATWPLRSKPPLFLFGRPRHPIYDLLGLRYILTGPDHPLPFRLAFQDTEAWIYERPRPLPRLFLPARAVVYRGGNWADWLERNQNFSQRALVAPSAERNASWRARHPRQSSLGFSLPEPAHVHVQAHLAEPRLLASSVYQDGHWRLLVNGERRKTVLANGPFVGAWLPEGEQRVDLLYRPGVFVAGCVLAALALAAAAAWWVPAPRRRL